MTTVETTTETAENGKLPLATKGGLRAKRLAQQRAIAQSVEEHKQETSSNSDETLASTSDNTNNGHSNGEDSPSPSENGSHTDEQNTSEETSNGDVSEALSSNSAKNAAKNGANGMRKWKQKMEKMKERGYMRKAASNPELASNGDPAALRNATHPLARPSKEKPTLSQIDGLFTMYRKYKDPKSIQEQTDTTQEPTTASSSENPTEHQEKSQEKPPQEKLQEKNQNNDQSKSLLSATEEATPSTSKGASKRISFANDEEVRPFSKDKAPAAINPASKQLTDRISQLEEEKQVLEQQNKQLSERIKSLESKQLILKENPLNLEVTQQLKNIQGRLDLELSTKQVLKDYLSELQREIDSARKTAPTQQYKMMLMVQIFVWAIIIALLFVIVMRRSTPEPSLRVPH